MRRFHSEKYWRDKYYELKFYAKRYNANFPYRDVEQFQADYESYKQAGVKNIMKRMKYDTRYATSYKTALSLYHKSKELGESVTLEQLKKTDIADWLDVDTHKAEILKVYEEKTVELGKTAAAKYISNEFFGSP